MGKWVYSYSSKRLVPEHSHSEACGRQCCAQQGTNQASWALPKGECEAWVTCSLTLHLSVNSSICQLIRLRANLPITRCPVFRTFKLSLEEANLVHWVLEHGAVAKVAFSDLLQYLSKTMKSEERKAWVVGSALYFCPTEYFHNNHCWSRKQIFTKEETGLNFSNQVQTFVLLLKMYLLDVEWRKVPIDDQVCTVSQFILGKIHQNGLLLNNKEKIFASVQNEKRRGSEGKAGMILTKMAFCPPHDHAL